jgi:hypothetical protein
MLGASNLQRWLSPDQIMPGITKRILAVAMLFGWLGVAYLAAAEPVILESSATQTNFVELYTSEGCSSCPAAEKWFSGFQGSPALWKEIVPVAFHVDYWDGLGWADSFSNREFTERQRRYASLWGGDSVYTPGLVVNGREWRNWFTGRDLPKSSATPGKLRITVTDDNQIAATFAAVGPEPSQHLLLQVAQLGMNLQSDVKRGENSGRTLRHDFVVLDFAGAEMTKSEGAWRGALHFKEKSGTQNATAIAAWVSSTESPIPLQATGGWLQRSR